MPTEKTKWMYLNGSTYWFNNNNADITQYDAYLPYGELLVDEHSSSEDMPYKFNGKEMEYREELTTIGTDGLGYKYTENMIRREHHLPLRISHVTDTSEFPVMK